MKTGILGALMALAGIGAAIADSQNAQPLTLWYQQAAADAKPMNEALPIGNGRLGALVFGSPPRERLCLNEDSLWTGNDNPSGDYKSQGMGAYQVLGNLFVDLPAHTNAADYRRELTTKPR